MQLADVLGGIGRVLVWFGGTLVVVGAACSGFGYRASSTAPREQSDAGMMPYVIGVILVGAGILAVLLRLASRRIHARSGAA